MAETPPPATILVVDDNATNRRLLKATFQAEGLEVVLAEDGAAGLLAIERARPSLVLLDLRMPGLSGIETLIKARELAPQLPIIVLTAHGDVASAVEAMKLGAQDFLTRPIDHAKLVGTVRHALERRPPSAGDRIIEWMGKSAAIREVVRQIQQVAESRLTVLIEGETGTGKELVARAVHQESARQLKRFIALDCGAIPDTLLESELFGHDKGAFTGAVQRRAGYVQHANEGTLFLDEIANLPLAVQAKLLRVLQEREVQALGASRPVAVDVRFIAATNTPLFERAEAGSFRQDLYFRLAEFIITVPPLRERRDDILPLAQRFLGEAAADLRRSVEQISAAAAELLLDHPWPGNVRELRNVIRRAALQGAGATLEADLLKRLLIGPSQGAAPPPPQHRSLKEISDAATAEAEAQAILEALRQADGNKSQAARLLKIDFKTLHLRMKRYGLGARLKAR